MAGTLIIKVISTLLQTMAILLLDEENIFYLLGLITIVNLFFDRQNPIFISRTQSIFNLIKSIQLTYLLINSHDDEQLQIGMRIFMITSILRNLKILYAPKTPDKIKHRLLRVYYKAPFTFKYFQFIQDLFFFMLYGCTQIHVMQIKDFYKNQIIVLTQFVGIPFIGLNLLNLLEVFAREKETKIKNN